MKKFVLLLIAAFLLALLLPNLLNGQTPSNDCNLETRYQTPTTHAAPTKQKPLTPDPCQAKPKYAGIPILTCSPPTGEQIIKYGVRIVSETVVSSNCEVTTREISRDTFVESAETVFTKQNAVGGLWVVQFECKTEVPKTRPVGFMATLLPESAEYAGYWVTHSAEYSNSKDAEKARLEFKEKYPEFCSAFVRQLPENCQYRFEYRL